MRLTMSKDWWQGGPSPPVFSLPNNQAHHHHAVIPIPIIIEAAGAAPQADMNC
jgi:hypothetical protein